MGSAPDTRDLGTAMYLWREIFADDITSHVSVKARQISEFVTNGGIVVTGDMVPFDDNPGFTPLSRVGSMNFPFLESHFGNPFASNIYRLDGEGSARRVLLEGDAAALPSRTWADLQGDQSSIPIRF